jgi:predicted DNA-binding WGR domain protein
MSWTWLKRVDVQENVNRWYAVGVQSSLFDAAAVIRFWGSREKDYQRGLVRAFDDAETARQAADRLIRAKVRRKYQIVGGYVPDGLGDAAP